MTNDRELLQDALDVMHAAIKAGDWKVDGACDPDLVLHRIEARLAQCDAGEICLGCRVCPDAQPEQEPVAWCIVENGRVQGLVKSKPAVMNAEKWQPLYTAPPQREWQGLTDEEISHGLQMASNTNQVAGVRWFEAKLKEKNS